MARWLVVDSLSCPEQFFCSHLDSLSWYLAEAGEDVIAQCANFELLRWRGSGDAYRGDPDVVFALDRYDLCAGIHASKHIAQVAAITSPLPWEVRKPGGSPAYDLVISSIPWMVEAARAAGCRAGFQRLAFDHRALVCSMGVEKDIDCLFVGTRDGNHVKREQVLCELGGLVTIAPPAYGREYYKLVSRARALIHVGAEWSRGHRNALRLYEGAGLAALVISDGEPEPGGRLIGHRAETPEFFKRCVEHAVVRWRSDAEDDARRDQAHVLQHDGYVQRVPELLSWVRSL